MGGRDIVTNKKKEGAEMAKPKYETHVQPFLDKIPEWYKTMTVRQICTKLGVSKTTLYRYAKDHPELAEVLEDSKTKLVEDLKCALKQRALGYTWDEVQTTVTVSDEHGRTTTTKSTKRHVPPDLGSIHLLLKNLDPNWHDDDVTTMKRKERELQAKEKKAEAAEGWS